MLQREIRASDGEVAKRESTTLLCLKGKVRTMTRVVQILDNNKPILQQCIITGSTCMCSSTIIGCGATSSC